MIFNQQNADSWRTNHKLLKSSPGSITLSAPEDKDTEMVAHVAILDIWCNPVSYHSAHANERAAITEEPGISPSDLKALKTFKLYAAKGEISKFKRATSIAHAQHLTQVKKLYNSRKTGKIDIVKLLWGSCVSGVSPKVAGEIMQVLKKEGFEILPLQSVKSISTNPECSNDGKALAECFIEFAYLWQDVTLDRAFSTSKREAIIEGLRTNSLFANTSFNPHSAEGAVVANTIMGFLHGCKATSLSLSLTATTFLALQDYLFEKESQNEQTDDFPSYGLLT